MNTNYLYLLLFFFLVACEQEQETMVVCEESPMINPLESCCETEALEGTIGGFSFYLANVFTPDFDGVNDLFYVQAKPEDIPTVKAIRIRNASDSLVFEQFEIPPNDLGFAWDGSVGGLILRGVYSYEVDLELTTGETGTFTGEVCALPCFGADTTIAVFESFPQCFTPSQYNGEGGLEPTLPSNEEWPCLEF